VGVRNRGLDGTHFAAIPYSNVSNQPSSNASDNPVPSGDLPNLGNAERGLRPDGGGESGAQLDSMRLAAYLSSPSPAGALTARFLAAPVDPSPEHSRSFSSTVGGHSLESSQRRAQLAIAAENHSARAAVGLGMRGGAGEVVHGLGSLRENFVKEVVRSLEGGRAAILRPHRRRALVAGGVKAGLRPFQVSLLVAEVQESVRHGEHQAVEVAQTGGSMGMVQVPDAPLEERAPKAASGMRYYVICIACAAALGLIMLAGLIVLTLAFDS